MIGVSKAEEKYVFLKARSSECSSFYSAKRGGAEDLITHGRGYMSVFFENDILVSP